MKRMIFLFVVALAAMEIQAQWPSVTMVTANEAGSEFSFIVNSNSPFSVDCGDGTLINYNNANPSFILKGNTIKIYGDGITYLDVSNKKLTELRLAGLPSLNHLFCQNNMLTELDISNIPPLNDFDCSHNLITRLEIFDPKESSWWPYGWFDCQSNRLTIATMPVIDPYAYHTFVEGQAKFKLPEKNYTVGEAVDLSSQLKSRSGQTTVYKWRTVAWESIVLAEGVDYIETDGVFTFLRTFDDSIVCEMTNLNFYLWPTTRILISAHDYAAKLVTANQAGSEFAFRLVARQNSTPIDVDFGDGNLKRFTAGLYVSSIAGTLKGNTVKIYSEGIYHLEIDSLNLTEIDIRSSTSLIGLKCNNNQLTYLNLANNRSLKFLECGFNQLTSLDVSKDTALVGLNCSNNKLTSLDVSKNTRLNYLACNNNMLNLSTLPQKQPLWIIYEYSPQAVIQHPYTSYALGEAIDLSGQLNADGRTSAFTWKTMSGVILTEGTDYTADNGVFTINRQPGEPLYCEITNVTFPGLVLTTSSIDIIPAPPLVAVMETAADEGTDFEFRIHSYTNDAIIYVDFGNNKLTRYTISDEVDILSGILTGNTVKIYGEEVYHLAIEEQSLTSLDVSFNRTLTGLDCRFNLLTELDLSENINLTQLICMNNNLPGLDVSKNTALSRLICWSNQITELDLSNNTELVLLYCYDNKLTALVLSNNKLITNLNCAQNQITKLNLTNNDKIREIYCHQNQLTELLLPDAVSLSSVSCYNNRLTFATIPLVRRGVTYSYHDQAPLQLPRNNYEIGEPVDLRSQLTTGGQPTIYIWKTQSGQVLAKGVDYIVSNGVFTFIKAFDEELYCEMTNVAFPSLVLTTTNIIVSVTPPPLAVVITTAGEAGGEFTCELESGGVVMVEGLNNLNITYFDTFRFIRGTISGNTVKIYAKQIIFLKISSQNLTSLDVSNSTRLMILECQDNLLTSLDLTANTELTDLYCYNNKLNALDLSKNTALSGVTCFNNQLNTLNLPVSTGLISLLCDNNSLTFSTLPIGQPGLIIYNYSPQSQFLLPKTDYEINEPIDLSSQLTAANGQPTVYIWKTQSGRSLAQGVDYTVSNGVFTFIRVNDEELYCEMSNIAFPDLILSTININVTQSPVLFNEKITGYPNPVKDYLNINRESEILRVEIFDASGFKLLDVHGIHANSLSIPVSDLPEGLLILKVYDANGISEGKIIKEK